MQGYETVSQLQWCYVSIGAVTSGMLVRTSERTCIVGSVATSAHAILPVE
jgi:hypothetical protein